MELTKLLLYITLFLKFSSIMECRVKSRKRNTINDDSPGQSVNQNTLEHNTNILSQSHAPKKTLAITTNDRRNMFMNKDLFLHPKQIVSPVSTASRSSISSDSFPFDSDESDSENESNEEKTEMKLSQCRDIIQETYKEGDDFEFHGSPDKKYHLDKHLGQGTYGLVFKVTKIINNDVNNVSNFYSLKVIPNVPYGIALHTKKVLHRVTTTQNVNEDDGLMKIFDYEILKYKHND